MRVTNVLIIFVTHIIQYLGDSKQNVKIDINLFLTPLRTNLQNKIKNN